MSTEKDLNQLIGRVDTSLEYINRELKLLREGQDEISKNIGMMQINCGNHTTRITSLERTGVPQLTKYQINANSLAASIILVLEAVSRIIGRSL